MYSKLTFGQKLGVWLGCAIFIVIGGITAICFQLSKSPPKDMDKLIPSWAHPKFSSEDAWKASEKVFSGQIEKHPKRANLYRERGLIRWWLDRKDEAMVDFNKAIELDPNDYLCLSYRGQLHTLNEEYDAALLDLNKSIELEKNDGSLYYQRGIAYHWKDKLDEAQKDYEKALTFDYDKRRVHNALGRIFKRRQELDKAISEFQESLKFPEVSTSSVFGDDSDDESPFEDLIDLLIAKGKIKEAQDKANAWIEDSSKMESAYEYAESTAKALDDKDALANAQKKHISYLNEQIAEAPIEEAWRISRAEVYLDMGDKVHANEDFLFAIEEIKKQKRPYLNHRLAMLYEKVGESKKSKDIYAKEIAKFDQEIKKKPKDASLKAARAFQYIHIKDYSAALKTLRALKDKDGKRIASSGIFDASMALGDYKGALEVLTESTTEGTYYFRRLAEVYEKLGRHKEAAEAARKAIDLDFTQASAYYWLGKALEAMGETQESKLRLQQAVAFDYDPSERY